MICPMEPVGFGSKVLLNRIRKTVMDRILLEVEAGVEMSLAATVPETNNTCTSYGIIWICLVFLIFTLVKLM